MEVEKQGFDFFLKSHPINKGEYAISWNQSVWGSWEGINMICLYFHQARSFIFQGGRKDRQTFALWLKEAEWSSNYPSNLPLTFKCDNFGRKVKFSINGLDHPTLLIVATYDSRESWVSWPKFQLQYALLYLLEAPS